MGNKKLKCYNSGRISGLSYLYAYRKFESHDQIISDMNYIPVNPMKKKLRASAPWIIHMVADIFLLLFCPVIFMQEDWMLSRGARIEHRISCFLGKEIIYNNVK